MNHEDTKDAKGGWCGLDMLAESFGIFENENENEDEQK